MFGVGRVSTGSDAEDEADSNDGDDSDDGDGKPGISLAELLARGPNTSLTDRRGNTALHVLVQRCIDKEYFPDLAGNLIFHVVSPSDMYRDDDRADYLKEAFPVMIEAGYKADDVNGEGKSVTDMLKEGYTRYSKEVRKRPYKGQRDMLAALKSCLKLIGQEPPKEQQRPRGSPGAAAAAAAAAQGPTWPYGKYKGAPIRDLDFGYVEWLCDNFDFGPPEKKVLLRQLVDAGKVRQGPGGRLVALR